MPSKKRATPVSLQPLDALFGTNEESINGISEIAIGSLHPFPNHPFQVRDDKKMEELSESIIRKYYTIRRIGSWHCAVERVWGL